MDSDFSYFTPHEITGPHEIKRRKASAYVFYRNCSADTLGLQSSIYKILLIPHISPSAPINSLRSHKFLHPGSIIIFLIILLSPQDPNNFFLIFSIPHISSFRSRKLLTPIKSFWSHIFLFLLHIFSSHIKILWGLFFVWQKNLSNIK